MRCSSRCASSRRPWLLSSSSRSFSSRFDRLDRLHQRRARRHIVRVGVDLDEFEIVLAVAGERIELLDILDGVAEQVHAPGAVFIVRREDVDDVAADAKGAAGEIGLGALVLQRDEVGDQLPLVDALALLQREGHRGIGFDRADTVDAGHRGDDDDVVALQQRARRRVAHAVDLLVDRRILLDIGVGPRHIGLGLVVVVIGDEILHRVVGEETLELAIELRRQRLVRRENDGRALRRLDHLGHGVGLAGAGDAEQHLGAVVALDAFDQFLDRGRLVALRLVFGFDHEGHAAFGFLRARRPVRRPDPHLAVVALEFGAAVADQVFQRVGGGLDAERFHLAARRPRQRLVIVFRGRQAELPRQFGVEGRDRRRGAVIGGLNSLCGASSKPCASRLATSSPVAARRGPRAVRGGLAAGAAVPGIVRRRLQPGARAHAGIAAVDRGIEQFGQRRPDRLHVGPRRLGIWRFGFRGFAGFFGSA